MNKAVLQSSLWEEVVKDLNRNWNKWDSFEVSIDDIGLGHQRLLVTVTLVPPDPIAASIQNEQTAWD